MRQPIFSAIKDARNGKVFTPADVVAIDEFLDRLNIPRVPGQSGLQPSPRIVAFVQNYEKMAKMRPDGRVEAYMPTPKDRPTIGFGTTGPDVKMGTVWTVEQAKARFASHFAEFADSVRKDLGNAPTTQDQFDAMVSLAYNIGKQAFRDSTLLKLHKAGDFAGAAAQFGRWNKQAGVVLNGLTRRRGDEAAIYRGQA